MDRVNCCCCCCCCCCTHFSTFPKMTLLWLDTLLSSTQLSASERGGRGAEFSQQQRLRRRERQTFAGYVLGLGPLLLVLPLTTTCGTGGKRDQGKTAPALYVARNFLEQTLGKPRKHRDCYVRQTLRRDTAWDLPAMRGRRDVYFIDFYRETPHGICPQWGGRLDVYFIDFYRRLKLVFREVWASEAVGRVCCRSLFVSSCYRLFVCPWLLHTFVCL